MAGLYFFKPIIARSNLLKKSEGLLLLCCDVAVSKKTGRECERVASGGDGFAEREGRS